MVEPIYVAKGDSPLYLLPQLANRHGLIAGATGTGKTVTLQCLAEGFSKLGVPSFMADVKGDLSGISQPGQDKPSVAKRIEALGLEGFKFAACPVTFWDVFGEQGHPVRATISEMGPLLLSRLLNLNDTQSGVLTLTFKIADDNGLLLLDLKDLQAMVQYVGDNAGQFKTEYGNISAASVGAIQRALLALDQQGGSKFFGEPALDLFDFIQTGPGGRGMVNILAADKLLGSPLLYATFLLWLLAELFERLPEVGDLEKPKLVFFFDEAHLLFNDIPKALLDKIEQVIRLVRSKGVGVYFVTQNPLDIPDTVLGQLSNRIQHALRAFTPRDQKAVKAAATTLRPNPPLDVESAITQLGVGEALVSLLEEKGTPAPVQRALIVPPSGQLGPITPAQRQQLVGSSTVYGHYEKVIDRESAYEILKQRSAQPAPQPRSMEEKQVEFARKRAEQSAVKSKAKPSETGHVIDAFAKSAARSVGTSFGRELVRGILGSLFGGSKRR
ncbi:MAG TPA: helicase HerA-like domain-containing protein [Gemmataceae bacterium]|nr:helicase HerA-like domain-containing protein [Gemmataceae bacterium]